MTPLPPSTMSAPANAGYGAQWFDGWTAQARVATMLVSGGMLRVISADRLAEYPLTRVVASRPVAGVPPRLMLPDGGTLVLDDRREPPGLPRDSSVAHRLESNVAFVCVALIVLVAAAVFAWRDGLPWVATQTAKRIPIATEAALGKATLETLDRIVFRPSALPSDRRHAVSNAFAAMLHAGDVHQPIDLQFRAGRYIGPNAVALPGGIVVVTDELVRLLESTDLIDAVLAHEVGHVIERHGLQALLRRSASALIFGVLLGDVSGIGSVAALAPAVFMNLSHSRDAEALADAYAFALLERAGSSADRFATALAMLAQAHCVRTRKDAASRERSCELHAAEESDTPGYLSTHPDIAARIGAARDRAARAAAAQLDRTGTPLNADPAAPADSPAPK